MKSINVVLIGSGIASASLAVLLRELNPKINILMLEKLPEIAKESSFALNNAGTGHAGYCELNYTPQLPNGDIDMNKAFKINAGFQSTLHLLSALVKEGKIKNPEKFITPTPHASLVWGGANSDYLEQRYENMKNHACFDGIEFSKDLDTINSWMPLCTTNATNKVMAATKINYGADVNFGQIATSFIDYVASKPGFELKLENKAKDIKRIDQNKWRVKYQDLKTKQEYSQDADFVFIGAGGASLTLLQKTGLDIARNYGGFPVAGQWLVCENPEVVEQHNAKVYGRAAVDALPMSMPHLDRRRIDGKDYIIFGPYAEFTTKFLKNGSPLDLFGSIKSHNLFPMANVGLKNLNLVTYLMKEATASFSKKIETLKQFYPQVKKEDWQIYTAGERVQIVKKVNKFGGNLVLGTEVVTSEDGSLAAFLGASPGASIIINSMLEVVEKCLQEYLPSDWKDRLNELVPTYFSQDLNVLQPEKINKDKFLEVQNIAFKQLNLV